ncbi:hypothetical protein [Actinomadura sediminis]|uniref:Uncharacterized protein n=1 Tax=Actinomadura sediminis TaxID=1038904 RepID=A0ABW3EU06_9ACTN
MRAYDSELDEQVAMVVDLYEPALIDATAAVTILRETLQVCPQVCAMLLRREMRRRDQEVADRNAVAEREIRDMGLDDGSWGR